MHSLSWQKKLTFARDEASKENIKEFVLGLTEESERKQHGSTEDEEVDDAVAVGLLAVEGKAGDDLEIGLLDLTEQEENAVEAASGVRKSGDPRDVNCVCVWKS